MSDRHDRLREVDDAVYRRFADVEYALQRLHDALLAAEVDVGAAGLDAPPITLLDAYLDRASVLSNWAVEAGDALGRLDVVDRGMTLESMRARIFEAEGEQ